MATGDDLRCPVVETAEDGHGRPGGRWWMAVALLVLLAAGLAVRLHHLDDSVLAFHPTRQLHSAIIARDLYLEQTADVDDPGRVAADRARRAQGGLEAPVNEYVVAGLYLVNGRESTWLAGVWASILWLVGGAFLVAAVGRFVGRLGQLVTLAVHLFTPLAVAAGRSFQPDPLMVTAVVGAAWASLRWVERRSWGRLVAAGAMAGLAVLVKPFALPLVLGAFAAVAAHDRGVRRTAADPQAWAFAALAVGPWVLALASGSAARSDPGDYFVASLLASGAFYRAWGRQITDNIGLVVLAVGLVGGLLVARGRARALLLGLVGGYLAACGAFDFRVAGHSYYHLVLVPILALGCGIAVDAVPGWLARRELSVARLLVAPVLVLALLALVASAWGNVPTVPDGNDLPGDVQAAAALVEPGGRVLGMTDAYGRELAYYGDLVVVGEIPGPGDRQLAELQGEPVPDLATEIDRTGAEWVVVTSLEKEVLDPDTIAELRDHYVLVGSSPTWSVYDVRTRR